MYKDKRVYIRLSELDYQTIKNKAEKLQMSVSEYMRTSALNRQIREVKTK